MIKHNNYTASQYTVLKNDLLSLNFLTNDISTKIIIVGLGCYREY